MEWTPAAAPPRVDSSDRSSGATVRRSIISMLGPSRPRTAFPGTDEATKLVEVSRNGFRAAAGLDVKLTARDLLAAWQAR